MPRLKAFINKINYETHWSLNKLKIKVGNKFQKGWHRGEKSYLRPCVQYVCRDVLYIARLATSCSKRGGKT